MAIFKFIISFLLIVLISSGLIIFKDKLKVKEFYKSLIVGAIFGAVTILCNWFKVKDYISLSNSAVLICGILFGGPAGLTAGVIGAAERFIFINKVGLSVVKFSAPITLLLCGVITLFVRKFFVEENKIKWYFGFIGGGIIEAVCILMMFLFHLNYTSSVYYVIKNYGLITVLVNAFTVGVVLLLASYVPNSDSIKKEGKIGIQTRTQISLWITIIIGLVSVTNVAYGVLSNNSTKERENTIALAIDDVENNLSSDVDNDFSIIIQKYISLNKTYGSFIYTEETFVSNPIKYPTFEDYKNYWSNNILKGYQTQVIFDYITQPTDLTVVYNDGTIFASTDEFIRGLSNISEFNIEHLEMLENYSLGKAKCIVSPFEYVEQKGENLKIVQKQYDNNYYFMLTFNQEAYHKQIVNSLKKSIAKRHFGKSGYLVVTDSENNIVSSPADGPKENLDLSMYEKGQHLVCAIDGVDYYTYIDDFIDFNVIAIINKLESDNNMQTALKLVILSEFGVFLIIYLLICLANSSNVINPLKKVNKTLSNITKGNLDEKASEYSSKELKELSNDINTTVDSLKEYMGREAKLIKKDLDFAKNIQSSALPKLTDEYLNNQYFDIFALMNTAKEVGGDFYDFELLDSKHLFILIADVSGKGVPAALFMMQSKTIIKTLVENSKHIDEALTKANEKLCESNSAGMFVTCWCAVINLETGIMEYVNAGHNPPLIKKNNGEFAYILSKPGLVLGALDFTKYTSNTINMESGDQLLLYTDGVTEAYSANNELYGENRLLNFVKVVEANNSNQFCDLLLKNVKDFSRGKEQSDDITMLHFKYNGNNK